MALIVQFCFPPLGVAAKPANSAASPHRKGVVQTKYEAVKYNINAISMGCHHQPSSFHLLVVTNRQSRRKQKERRITRYRCRLILHARLSNMLQHKFTIYNFSGSAMPVATTETRSLPSSESSNVEPKIMLA